MTPHEQETVRHRGAPLRQARAALILLHGRGASAEDILELGESLAAPATALLAPQAAGSSWYPQRFLAPLAQNEPFLTSALAVIGALIATANAAGIPTERIGLVGFSQGACLTLEYAARHPRRYGAVVAFSGAVIGPPGTPRPATGDLAATPIYLGCGDRDFHIPEASVRESAQVLRQLQGDVRLTIFPGMDHTINDEEFAAAQALVGALSA